MSQPKPKLARSCFVAVMCLTLAATAEAKDAQKASGKIEKQVRDVINLHFEGIRKGDASMLKQAWDVPNAHVKHVASGRVTMAPIEKSIKLWTSKPAPKATSEILSVDVVGNQMAMAKVKLNWHGGDFTDYLTLLKTRGGWKIVEKTYVGRALSPYAGF